MSLVAGARVRILDRLVASSRRSAGHHAERGRGARQGAARAADAADRFRHVPRRCRAYRVVEGFGFATLTVAAPKVIVAATAADCTASPSAPGAPTCRSPSPRRRQCARRGCRRPTWRAEPEFHFREIQAPRDVDGRRDDAPPRRVLLGQTRRPGLEHGRQRALTGIEVRRRLLSHADFRDRPSMSASRTP